MFRGICEVAVVAESDFALVAVDDYGLGVEQGFVTGGRVAGVADGQRAPEFRENVGLKNLFDFAHGAVKLEFGAVARDDAGGFLAAVLESVEPKVHEVRGFGMAEDAEDATVVVEVVVENWKNLAHKPPAFLLE